MTRTRQAISNFLRNRVADSPFLLARYTTDLETQIMCDTNGEPGEAPGTYTDGSETWGNKRWPYQAGTDPNFSDPELGFSPAAHVDRVGTTWWDYVNLRSVAVGIDIDSIDGHAETTTTNDQADLDALVEKLSALDYVTIVRSTGGKGLHVYVFFDKANLPEAKNHHEHTIVARKTLELISTDIGYPLKDHVDCVGSVFWIWAAKSPAGHPGFSLVKEGGYLDSARLAVVNLPTPSVRGKSNMDFETVAFDEEHKRIIEAISREPYYFNIRSDINLIHTHTCAIRDAVANGLEVLGTFETNSSGSDPQTANCFMAPQRNGVFRVYRFGQSQHEPSWQFTGGKNFCTLNDTLSVEEVVSKSASKFRNGKYSLTASGIEQIAAAMGESLPGPAPAKAWAELLDGCVHLFSKTPATGWTVGEDGVFQLVLEARTPAARHSDRLLARSDEFIRFVTQDGNPLGWFIRLADGTWMKHRGFTDISCLVTNRFQEFAGVAKSLMLENPWQKERIPFAPEYPGGRVWNFDAPSLAVEPAESGGDHPHFDMILDHIGSDLDPAVLASEWCRRGGLVTGADYLRCWIASLIHHTDQPLPYLFLSGPQNSGKSVFHESLGFLFSGGIASANSALTSDHNGELDGCFLAYVEERDLADKRAGAYAKIKEWVTGRTIQIHEKYVTPYLTKNYLHFVQMSNSTTHLPLEDGDTRIVALDVPSLERPIPKAVLEAALRREAPRFLRTLLNTIIPPPCDRLRIPALQTETKRLMERRAMSPLMSFIKDHVYPCQGKSIEISEFYRKYTTYCNNLGVRPDQEFQVLAELINRSDRLQVGHRKSKTYVVNVSLDPNARPNKTALHIDKSGKIS